MGVAHAEDWSRDADVVLLMADPDSTPRDLSRITAKALERADKPVLRVLTKADSGDPDWADGSWIKISCLEETGIDILRHRLAAIVDAFMGNLQDSPSYITTVRQLHAVQRAKEALARFYTACDESQYEECLAFELQEAARALASIVGEITHDDVLDALFSKFCIGK
jgi:tRNA modification GTPase